MGNASAAFCFAMAARRRTIVPMVYDEITDPFRRLVRIMQRLQEPGGCPWDLEQTHESLKPYMVEEAYEALDAIDSGDPKALAEELGDVLLQVVFHSVLSARNGGFNVDDVAAGAATKMVRRHPHVFGEYEAKTAADVLQNWERLKAAERQQKAAEGAEGTDSGETPKGLLSGVPRHLPALLRAQRMQEKAARVGFDWKEALPVLDKVEEEIRELREAIQGDHKAMASDEFGDIIFSLVNLARFLEIDAEESTRQTCEKFQWRFEHIEAAARKQGRTVEQMSVDEMEAEWERAKGTEQRA